MNETQLLTLMLVIKKIKKEVKKQNNSFSLIADDIKELDKRIKQISLEDLKKDFKDKMITLEDSYKAILEAHNKEIDTKLVDNTIEQESVLNTFKNTLKEIETKVLLFNRINNSSLCLIRSTIVSFAYWLLRRLVSFSPFAFRTIKPELG